MRPQPDGIHFPGPLVLNVSANEFLGEYVTFEQKLVVSGERVESVFERTRHRWHAGKFFRAKVVDVLIQGRARVHAVLDAIKAGHHHGSEGEIGIAAWIGRAELDPLRSEEHTS